MTIKDFAKNLWMYTGVLSVVIPFFLAALVVIVFTPMFMVNDDVSMMGFVEGFRYKESSPNIVFSNVAIGQMLQWLYSALPHVPWYGVYLYSLQLTSFSVILFAVLRNLPQERIWVLIGCVPLIVIGTRLLLTPSFTSTALLAGAAGVFLHLGIRTERHFTLMDVVAGVLAGSSYLIRPKAFLGAVVFCAPLLLIFVVRKRAVSRTVVFAVTAALTAGAAHFYQHSYYETKKEWADWHEFNQFRGTLHETPRLSVPNLPEILDKLDWSENDLAMFKAWMFTDGQVFSRDALRHFVTLTAGVLSPRGSLHVAQDAWRRYGLEIVTALFLVAWATLTAESSSRWVPIIYFCFIGSVLFYLGLSQRLPPRVALPGTFILMMAFLTATRVRAEVSNVSVRRVLRFVAVATVTICAITLWEVVLQGKRNAERINRAEARALWLERLDKDGVFIANGATGLPDRYLDPLAEVPSVYHRLRFVSLGWSNRSPDQLAYLQKMGVPQPELSIMTDSRVYLVTKGRQAAGVIERFVEEHYGISATLHCLEVDDGLTVCNRDSDRQERIFKTAYEGAPELLKGTEFSDLSAWVLVGNARRNGGSNALLVTESSPAYQVVRVQSGRNYVNSVVSRCAGESTQGRVQINWADSSGQLLESSISIFSCTGYWSRKMLRVAAPDGAAYAHVYTASHAAIPMEFKQNSLLDVTDISIVEGSAERVYSTFAG